MRRRLCLLTALALCVSLFTPALAAEGEDPAPAYDVTWEALEGRIRAGGYSAQALGENLQTLEALDYETLEKDLRDNINDLTRYQWYMVATNNNAEVSRLQESYDTLRDAYDALVDGDLRQDNEDAARQIENGLDQIVVGGQTLYLSILSLERSLADGARGLAALDRRLAELRLRQSLGQVSRQQVESVEKARADTQRQLDTLKVNITSCKIQLQALMGEEPTGELTLAPLPETALDQTEPDYAADLAAAQAASWALRDAQRALDDAQEDWEDAKEDRYHRDIHVYEYTMAQHTWAAAQASYQAEGEKFELSFRSLYTALAVSQADWEGKMAEVDYQEKLLAAAQTRYERGLISRFALLEAQDDLSTAESAAQAAWQTWFSAWNDYQNAVHFGIV